MSVHRYLRFYPREEFISKLYAGCRRKKNYMKRVLIRNTLIKRSEEIQKELDEYKEKNWKEVKEKVRKRREKRKKTLVERRAEKLKMKARMKQAASIKK